MFSDLTDNSRNRGRLDSYFTRKGSSSVAPRPSVGSASSQVPLPSPLPPWMPTVTLSPPVAARPSFDSASPQGPSPSPPLPRVPAVMPAVTLCPAVAAQSSFGSSSSQSPLPSLLLPHPPAVTLSPAAASPQASSQWIESGDRDLCPASVLTKSASRGQSPCCGYAATPSHYAPAGTPHVCTERDSPYGAQSDMTPLQ